MRQTSTPVIMSEMEMNKLFMLSEAYMKGHESLWVHFSEIHILICHPLTAYMHLHVVYSCKRELLTHLFLDDNYNKMDIERIKYLPQ